MRTELLVFDGFDEIDVFGPFEVLATAGLDVELVTLQPGPVRSMRGVQLHIPTPLGRPDAVIVPGGGWLDRATEGAWAQAERGVLTSRLAELAGTTRWMSSVCTGGMLLAAAGLLTDRYATTNRDAYEELRPQAREVLDERVVEDGNILTSGGLTSGFDLALWITECELGTAAADRVSRTMEYPRQGRVWHGPQRPT
jgi:transcriptional regulator GlxA family with amidase domain